jgi:ribosomal protein S18 acetylase RimI-like enzyme
MSHSVTFTELRPADFRLAISQLVAVYAAAMNPPDRMLAGRESIMERHATNPGFHALVAIAARGDHPPAPDGSAHGHTKHESAEIAGFTYGFHGAQGQWWHDMVAGALGASPGSSRTPAVAAWVADSFEVAELHVLPAYQGAGIGRSLLLRLLSDRPERTALLSTQDAESRARRLYRGVGFTDLLTGFRFSGGEPPYAVMGAALPLRQARHNSDGDQPAGYRPDAASAPPPDSPRPSS